MDIRAQRQAEAVSAYLSTSDRKSIVNACPRFGKIKVAIDIMKEMEVRHVLIFIPRRDIEKEWWDNFGKFSLGYKTVEFCTFASIKKVGYGMSKVKGSEWDYDLIIVDEPHELSVNQQIALAKKTKDYPVLGLTGTMTQKTRTELYNNLNLDVCFKYTIDQGVEEGILTDYSICIHKVPLEGSVLRYTSAKGTKYTEKGYFDLLQSARRTAKAGKKWFLDIKMIHLLQNSFAKMRETISLINEYEDDRVLVFCGTTEIADQLGIPVYHSKAKEKEILLDFCVGGGEVDQLATIKMMQAGITINPIKRGIVNYMSGNPEDCAQKICRFLGYEYDNPLKQADIHIVSSTEDFELERLRTGLLFFDSSKISYKNV